MAEKTIARQRRERASALLREKDFDALVITDPHNIRYLTGFSGSNAAVLLYEGGRAVLYTDPRYTVQSKRQADCPVRIARGPLTEPLVSDIRKRSFARVGFEADRLTVAQFETLRKEFPARSSLEAAPFHIVRLRMVKDEGEISLIRASVTNNSRALEAALKRLRPGMTEGEFAAEIDYQNRKLGAEGSSFDTIVAAGERSSLPHAHPGATKIGPGMLLIDMGALREGYASDMTRMVHVGRAGTKYRKAYRAVLEAQMAAIEAVRGGAAVGLCRSRCAHHLEETWVRKGLCAFDRTRIGARDS